MALVSSSDIVSFFNTGDEIAPATLVNAEQRAVEWLERMTGRPLQLNNSHQAIIAGPGGYELLLPYPRKPSGTIAIEERAAIGDSWSTVSSSNYEVIDEPARNTELVLRTDSVWPRSRWALRLTMQVGYDDTTCPDDLKRTILRLVAFELQGRFITFDEVDSDRRQSRTSEMPWDVKATIKRYRRTDWRARLRGAA